MISNIPFARRLCGQTVHGVYGRVVSLSPYAVGQFSHSHDRFAEPITTGDYPQIMKDLKKDKLPSFTDAEKRLLKGSTDFLA